MDTAGADLDAQGKALLEEDLRSPCTEEIAVFRAFARGRRRGQGRLRRAGHRPDRATRSCCSTRPWPTTAR